MTSKLTRKCFVQPRPPRETRPVHSFVTSLNVVLTRSSKTKRIVAFVQLSLLAHAHFGVRFLASDVSYKVW